MHVTAEEREYARRVVDQVERANVTREQAWRAPVLKSREPSLEWSCFEYYWCIIDAALATVPISVGRGSRTVDIMGHTVDDSLQRAVQYVVNISIPRFYLKYQRHVKVETGWWTTHGTPAAFPAHFNKRSIEHIRESYLLHRQAAQEAASAGARDTGGNDLENINAMFDLMPTNGGVHTVALTRRLIGLCNELNTLYEGLESYCELTVEQARRGERERQDALQATTSIAALGAQRQHQRNVRNSVGSDNSASSPSVDSDTTQADIQPTRSVRRTNVHDIARRSEFRRAQERKQHEAQRAKLEALHDDVKQLSNSVALLISHVQSQRGPSPTSSESRSDVGGGRNMGMRMRRRTRTARGGGGGRGVRGRRGA